MTQSASTSSEASAKSAAAAMAPDLRIAHAEGITRRNVFWALGAGVVPIPFLDIAAVTAVNLKLVRELSDFYGVAFKEKLAKKITMSLLSALGLVGIGSMLGLSLAKCIPLVGTTLGFVSVSVLSGAFVHSLGRVLVMHFEAGGTLLDFDPAAMRDYFKQEFDKAKVSVSKMQSESSKPAS